MSNKLCLDTKIHITVIQNLLKYIYIDPNFTFPVGWVAGLIKIHTNLIKAELAAELSFVHLRGRLASGL